MDGAALLLLVSGVGVGFGWQPMPDGSQRYEYVVQVEPELAATLAAGQSIPIVADIPAEVQPIGRIRMVVGREELPRQRLVTHLKPATDGMAASTDGVKLAQYNQAPAPRYGSPPAAAGDPYAPGQTSPASQEPENAWNSQPDQSITPTEGAPPSGQALFGQPQSGGGNAWNNGTATQAVADATAGAVGRFGDEMQRAVAPVVAPVREGLEQVDSEVRGAVGNLGERTKSLVDELRQPFNPQPQLSPDSRVPAVAGAGAEGAQAWNQGSAAVVPENPLRSGGTDAGSHWNQGTTTPDQTVQPPSTPPFASTPVGAAQPGGGDSAGTEWNNTPATAATDPRNGNAGRTQGAASGDPWAGVPDPRNQTAAPQAGAPAGVPDLANRPMPFGGIGGDPQNAGPRFPGLGSMPTPSGAGSAATPGATPGTTGSGPAAVASDMLRQPADRPLEDAPLYQGAATVPGLATLPSSPAPQRPAAAVTPAGQTGTASAATAAQPAGRDNTLAVLVAWVLLTGSIAGNMYLFWSYLDVRQKYRSLVRKTARAVGSRFSAA
jgi:hypothetical protein